MFNRFSGLWVIVTFMLLLSACGESDDQSVDVGAATEAPVSEAEPAAEAPASEAEPGVEESAGDAEPGVTISTGTIHEIEPWTGDFDGMTERRVIRALTTFNQTQYFLDDGRPRGITYEALMGFEKFVNEKLGTGKLELDVVIIPVARDELLPALVQGLGDIAAANLTITPERLETVDFSDPYLTDVSELVVTGPAAEPVQRLEDLAGKEIHVRRSSSYFGSLESLQPQFEAAGLEPIRIREASELFETQDLLEMVNAGMLPMTVADSHLANFWVQFMEGIVVNPELAVRTGGSIGWAFRKDSPKLAEIVNGYVKENKKGTMIGNVLFKRYLKENRWVAKPLTDGEVDKMDALLEHFNTYADMYELDSLLVAAQAYQESGFDHSVRSKAGAVGIMQLLPSTAADPNVGIPDIDELEDNIHAGTKYLDFLSKRYFSENIPDPLNRRLLALAAYNAGPARINQLRGKAEAQGLDPGVWFHNVEQLAPRETVQYVSNIFKYYVTYREHIRQAAEKAKAKG